MENKKYWIVKNIDENHSNQSENKCETLEQAEKTASCLVTRYPHLTFVIYEAKKIAKVKRPVDLIDLE